MTEREFTAEARKYGIPDNELASAFTDFEQIRKYVPDVSLQDFLKTVKQVLQEHEATGDSTVSV